MQFDAHSVGAIGTFGLVLTVGIGAVVMALIYAGVYLVSQMIAGALTANAFLTLGSETR